MRSIDIHAHISPAGYLRALEAGEDWYGIAAERKLSRAAISFLSRCRHSLRCSTRR